MVFVDGPSASGKSTYVRMLHDASGYCRVSYKAFGFANLLAAALLQVFPSRSVPGEFDQMRDDPMLRLDEKTLSKLAPLFGPSELLYKALQILKVLAVSGLAKTVVDEGILLRRANYVNALRRGGISRRAFDSLVAADFDFIRFLSRRKRPLYIYFDLDDSALESRWSARGHTRTYDRRFADLVRSSWNLYLPSLSALHIGIAEAAAADGGKSGRATWPTVKPIKPRSQA